MNYTLYAKRYTLTIGWLYPELMSTYGDRGNVICLEKRCEWRGISVDIKQLNLGFHSKQLAMCNLLFMGGAQDTQQKIVSLDFSKDKIKALKDMVEGGIPGLYICGAYQFLGKYYKEADGTIVKGLDILDLYTESLGNSYKRLIGNIIIKVPHHVILGSEATPESPSLKVMRDSGRVLLRQDSGSLARLTSTLVGFENHGGRTYLGKDIKALGKVIKGFGNNGEDKTEGATYKNSFGSYLHGPILPKNPHFADMLIKLALEKKYQSPINLSPLDDSLEDKACDAIAKTLNVKI